MNLAWSLLGKACPRSSWGGYLEELRGGPLPPNTYTAVHSAATQRGESPQSPQGSVDSLGTPLYQPWLGQGGVWV